jgi:phosphate transport system substrate-binding protein
MAGGKTGAWCMLAVVLFAAAFAGCSRGNKGAGGADKAIIQIKGSDTMVHLASSWAEEFMKENKGVQTAVTGGGSGTGIAALINGTTDICASSRDIKPEEIEQAKAKGVEPKEFTVARDGIAIVVNPESPVDDLTTEQLRQIYTGEATNWNQVGGPDAKITVLSRESSSGTYVFFQEHVLDKQDYAASVRLMPATSGIIQSVSQDEWTIGYVGLGYAEQAGGKVKVLRVDGVEASEANVLDGSYPIARPLHLYTNGEPQGTVKKFVDFCLGEKGQAIVREQGYVTLK